MQKIEPYFNYILIAAVFLVYGNSLFNEYALDDAIVITENKFVKKGIDGLGDIFTTESFTGFFGFDKQLVAGGRYRPLSIATFAIEYEFFGKNPFISHFLNVLMYALVVLLIFKLFEKSKIITTQTAFHIAMLYALHPIHTEVVANIKGRDEIMAFLFVLAGIYIYLYANWNRLAKLLMVPVLFFLAMLSKEHAIAFVVLLPLLMYYLRKNKSEIIESGALVLIPAMLFFIIRFQVLGGLHFEESSSLMNNPFVDATNGERLATVLLTWLVYLKLLFIPHPLTYDYYPYHIELVGFDSLIPWLAIVLVVATIYFGARSLIKRKWAGYFIWFFAGTFFLMSNLYFSVGTFMNERFMFMPSLAFVVGLVYIFIWLNNNVFKKQSILLIFFFLIGLAYSAKTIDRNRDWKNDFTLFTHDVDISTGSAKGNCVAGGQWFEKAVETKDKDLQKQYYQKAYKYLDRSLRIYKTYNDAHLLMGNVKYGLKKPIDSVIVHYISILSRAPKHTNAWKNALAVVKSGTPEERVRWNLELLKYDKTNVEILYDLGVTYGRDLQQIGESEKYLKATLSYDKDNLRALKDLAVVYGITKRYTESVDVLQKVVEIKPKDASAWYNLGVSLNAINKIDQAQTAFDKSYELDPSRNRVVISK
jgi:tetratricopeptide (TPR) repeat protein